MKSRVYKKHKNHKKTKSHNKTKGGRKMYKKIGQKLQNIEEGE